MPRAHHHRPVIRKVSAAALLRVMLAATSLLAPSAASAQTDSDTIATPALRAEINVSGDIVRVGDLVDNAGDAAQVAVYRAPDLGTTGTLSASEIVATLRTHHVIGVDTRGLSEVTITRLARTVTASEVERQIARLLERRAGLGEAADISVRFDRELRTLQFEAGSGDMKPVYARYEPRNGRFDAMFEMVNAGGGAPNRLRFTGIAVETAEATVLTRAVERNEILRASDIAIERRPKSEIGGDSARRDTVIGMQARKQMRAGQVIRTADLGRPDIVQRDQMVTLVFQTDGLFLTMRAKALESGAEGDTVSVINLQSKRTVQGVVTGPGQITVSPPPPITTASIPVAPSAAQKAE